MNMRTFRNMKNASKTVRISKPLREDQVLDLIREEELWLERQPFLQALASGAFAPYQVKR